MDSLLGWHYAMLLRSEFKSQRLRVPAFGCRPPPPGTRVRDSVDGLGGALCA